MLGIVEIISDEYSYTISITNRTLLSQPNINDIGSTKVMLLENYNDVRSNYLIGNKNGNQHVLYYHTSTSFFTLNVKQATGTCIKSDAKKRWRLYGKSNTDSGSLELN